MYVDLQADLDEVLAAELKSQRANGRERLVIEAGAINHLDTGVLEQLYARGWLATAAHQSGRHVIVSRSNSRRGRLVSVPTVSSVRTVGGRLVWSREQAEPRLHEPREVAWEQVAGRAALLGSFSRHVYRFIARDDADRSSWIAERVGDCPGDCGVHCGRGHMSNGRECRACDGRAGRMTGYGLKQWNAGGITLVPEKEVEAKVAELAAARVASRQRREEQDREHAKQRAEADRKAAAERHERRIEFDRLRASLEGEPRNLADLKRRLVSGVHLELLLVPHGNLPIGLVRRIHITNSVGIQLVIPEAKRGISYLDWPKAGDLTYRGDAFVIDLGDGCGIGYRIVEAPAA